MKINANELDKWVRMNKSPLWEILQSDKKTALFSCSDTSIDDSIIALKEALPYLPSSEYKLRAKRKATDPNSSYLSVDFVVSSNDSTSNKQGTSMTDIERLYQEKLQQALDLKEKEFEIREYKRMHDELSNKFDKLLKQVKELEEHILDHLDEQKTSKSGFGNVLNEGMSNLATHGTKAVVDRFAGFKG